jgi:hypothetical protein
LELLEDRQAPATLTVNSTADTANPTDAYLSLREALAIFNSPTLPGGLSDQILAQISGTLHEGRADSIGFDPGQVTTPIILGGTQLELSLPGSTAAVTIDGGSGVTVDGNNASRVLQVDPGVQATLDHLTVTHGRVLNPTSGGGIYSSGALTLSNSTLSANSAGYSSGGLHNSHGTLTVVNSTVSSNSAVVGGGGITNDAGTMVVSNSAFTSNLVERPSFATYGGGIDNEGTLTVNSSAFISNFASYYGGPSGTRSPRR